MKTVNQQVSSLPSHKPIKPPCAIFTHHCLHSGFFLHRFCSVHYYWSLITIPRLRWNFLGCQFYKGWSSINSTYMQEKANARLRELAPPPAARVSQEAVFTQPSPRLFLHVWPQIFQSWAWDIPAPLFPCSVQRRNGNSLTPYRVLLEKNVGKFYLGWLTLTR